MIQELLKNTIEFNRPKKYHPIKVLGRGACGMTLQVRDAEMDVDFVIKKFNPDSSIEKGSEFHTELLDRFRDEARILFNINHPNVVRVFNFYDYRSSGTSYIVMELVDGSDIMDFIGKNPNYADKIFEKVLSGFVHLENKGVLHRDIRPKNILITSEGEPKIIDFGFGKDVKVDSPDKEKSVSLNWWCETPPEFNENMYDFQTEVYFLGKLFEAVIEASNPSAFKYYGVIRDMCNPNLGQRPRNFSDVLNRVTSEQFEKLNFTEDQKATYMKFSADLAAIFSFIYSSAEYHRNVDEVMDDLESLYSDVMLEEEIHAPGKLASIFVKGGYGYYKNKKPKTVNLGGFISMLESLSGEKRNIVLGNILTRLDSVDKKEYDGDMPF